MTLRKAAKGAISEHIVGLYYTSSHWVVYYPFTHDTEIDLVITKGPRIKRIQVKTVYACGDILRANIDHKSNPKYSPDTVDIMCCVWENRLWIIPMEDIEDETTLNFGKVDGALCRPRGNFDHSKYEV